MFSNQPAHFFSAFSFNFSQRIAWFISVVSAHLPTRLRHLLLFPGFVRRESEKKRYLFPSNIATINGSILLVSCAQRMGMRIGVFGGGRKEMLSLPNEGRFTQYNEGWTHGFTADVYLKRPGKYCFGTEGFICRYTYPLQALAPTWGPELSAGSLLFFFFIWKDGKKCQTSSV